MKPAHRKHLRIATLMWVGFSVVLLSVYMFVMAPQAQHREALSQEVVVLKKIYETSIADKEDQARSELDRHLAGLQDKLRNFVADTKDSADLVPGVAGLASENRLRGLTIRRCKSSELPDCTTISEDHVTITFSTSYNQFATFLNALERHTPVIFVDKFVITRSGEGGSNHEVKMELTVFAANERSY